MPSTIISLISDFGHDSGYVGVMKGVALSRSATHNALQTNQDV